jgi:hypothetical protein
MQTLSRPTRKSIVARREFVLCAEDSHPAVAVIERGPDYFEVSRNLPPARIFCEAHSPRHLEERCTGVHSLRAIGNSISDGSESQSKDQRACVEAADLCFERRLQ